MVGERSVSSGGFIIEIEEKNPSDWGTKPITEPSGDNHPIGGFANGLQEGILVISW